MKITTALAIAFLTTATPAFAQPVQVHGYTRSDGTYVRPHIRSSPDATTSNNYGPSRTSPQYSPNLPDLSVVSPQTRDADHDGIANMYDQDDDNDGVSDDRDSTQYGGRSDYDSLGNRPN